ncbi:MAG: hypothetical protein QOE16_1222 [Microbacteriaceae bacterium]|jgi:uncharacterized membrane protein|nr:hypothetical protein [Microbacteriaceae bacterium]
MRNSAERRRQLELVYRVGVIVKGLDGVIELVGGLLLWLAPGLLRAVLVPLSGTVAGDHPIRNFVAYWAGHFGQELAAGSSTFVVFFLLAHGIVKVVLVYCLLREYHWVYPYALAVLGLFAAYQVFVLVGALTVGMALLTALDFLIIWLVWREWRVLRST